MAGRVAVVILSDVDLRAALADGALAIDPVPADKAIQPASIELHLGREYQPVDGFLAFTADRYWLEPHEFVLAHTDETVTIGDALVGQLHGKSTLGRLGLAVHITAGLIDPGFSGQITLELFNCSPVAVELTAGMPIAQLTVEPLSTPAARPYGHPELGSHYQGQAGAVSARVDSPARPVKAVRQRPTGNRRGINRPRIDLTDTGEL